MWLAAKFAYAVVQDTEQSAGIQILSFAEDSGDIDRIVPLL